MAYELVYTSAPEGVMRGSYGFCVVACTRGMNPRLVATLEALSAYKPLYPHYAENARDNPVSRSHYICDADGGRRHILSRVCFNGVDHTRRSNKLASHLVLNESEAAVAAGGPGSLLLHEELFKDASWKIRAEIYETSPTIPKTSGRAAECPGWREVMGDPGWGGFLVQNFLDHPERNIYLAYDPAQQDKVIRLFDEAINLLPPERRWQVTFNTYFVTLPAGMSCVWRGVPLDSDALLAARRSPANVVVDLTKPRPCGDSGEWIEAARTGIRPADRPAFPPRPGNAEAPDGAATSRRHIFVIDDEDPDALAKKAAAGALPTGTAAGAKTPLWRRWQLWTAVAAAAVIAAIAAVIFAVADEIDFGSTSGDSEKKAVVPPRKKQDAPAVKADNPEKPRKKQDAPAVKADNSEKPRKKQDAPATSVAPVVSPPPPKPAPPVVVRLPEPPALLWLRAKNELYNRAKGYTTSLKLGDTGKNRIFILFGRRRAYPGEENEVFQTGFDEKTGVLTIKLKRGLKSDADGKFSVIADGRQLPLFFSLDTSRIDGGDAKYELSAASDRSLALKIGGLKLPERIYFQNQPVQPVYRLRGGSGGSRADLLPDGKDGLRGSYAGPELLRLRDRERELKQLEADLRRSPEKYIKPLHEFIFSGAELRDRQKFKALSDGLKNSGGTLLDNLNKRARGNEKLQTAVARTPNSPEELSALLQNPDVAAFLAREDNRDLREDAEKLQKELEAERPLRAKIAEAVLTRIQADELGIEGEPRSVREALKHCREELDRCEARQKTDFERAELFIVADDREFPQLVLKAQ